MNSNLLYLESCLEYHRMRSGYVKFTSVFHTCKDPDENFARDPRPVPGLWWDRVGHIWRLTWKDRESGEVCYDNVGTMFDTIRALLLWGYRPPPDIHSCIRGVHYCDRKNVGVRSIGEMMNIAREGYFHRGIPRGDKVDTWCTFSAKYERKDEAEVTWEQPVAAQ